MRSGSSSRRQQGRRETAYEAGDDVFQYAIDVMSQEAIIVAMVGSRTSKKTQPPWPIT
jgi:hypothetical protein